MILYVFKCTKCNHKFEKFKKLLEPNPKCCKCESNTDIIISVKPTFILKGLGFHKNDYNEWYPYNK